MPRPRPFRFLTTLVSFFLLATGWSWGQELPKFLPPDEGWAYTFDGDEAFPSDAPFDALDGTWDHINRSDRWDGSRIGEGSPGGVSAVTDEFGVDFLRVQDPGDPRDYDFDDPSNRRIYFTHLLEMDQVPEEPLQDFDSIVSDGVTLYFRLRLATAGTGPIDSWHPNGGDGIEDWPEQGIGYSQHNGGKSIISIKEADGANVAFGFDYGREVNKDLFNDNGLVLPHRLRGTEYAGEGISSDEKDADPDKDADDVRANSEGHIVPVSDLTSWQEFWVTIQAGQLEVDGEFEGTHVVDVYHGSYEFPVQPMTFNITAATGEDFRDDFEDQSYLAIGAGATGAEGAFDIDFFSWKPGVHIPILSIPNECGLGRLLPGDLDDDGEVGFVDFLVLSQNFGQRVNGYEHGDIDCNGLVEFADFLTLSGNFGAKLDSMQSVPEPTTKTLLLFLILPWARLRVGRQYNNSFR